MIRKVYLSIQGQQNLISITFSRQYLTGKGIEILQDNFIVCSQEQTQKVQEASISFLLVLNCLFTIRKIGILVPLNHDIVIFLTY